MIPIKKKRKPIAQKGIQSKYWIAITAILVIGLLEVFALSRGIDGVLFASATAGIGGIAGYALKGSRS